MRPPDWMRHGACVDHPEPDLWFPPPGRNTSAPAKAICMVCPVVLECREYAREERIDFGVWGGLTPAERCGRGRPLAVIEHGTYNGYRMHLRRGVKACDACLKAASEYQARAAARAEGEPRRIRCAHQFGCGQWALKGHDLCWVHVKAASDA